jgi:hypothetical protein
LERPRRIHTLLAGATVGLATASLMLATEPALAIVFGCQERFLTPGM